MSGKLSLAVLLFTAWTSLGQTAGQLLPLTNTRYGAVGASAVLRTDGTSPFVFWSTLRDVRVTRVVEGQNRSGEVLFAQLSAFDAAWTGSHFLAVTTAQDPPRPRVIGRLVDAKGHPAGEPFTILENAQQPRIAAGHGAVLMVYESAAHDTRAVLLTAAGVPSGAPVTIAPAVTRYAVSATANGFHVATSDAQTITATTLDTQGRVAAQSSLTRPGNSVDLYMASRGPRSLLIWADVERLEAVIIEGNGALGAPLVVDAIPPTPQEPIHPPNVSAVWNGNGWSVAYQAGRDAPRLRVAHLDSPAQTVISREETVGLRHPSLAVIGGKVMATWTPSALGHLEPAWLGALPIGPNAAFPVTFGAAEQQLEAAVASPGGMLAVWLETIDRRVSLRSGVRTHTGQWSEHLVVASAPATTHVHAATDGYNFVVFATFDDKTEAIFLDDGGRPTGKRVALPRPVGAATWGGSEYGIVDINGDARRLSPEGVLSAPVDLGVDWTGWSIASHGNGYVVAGGRVLCQFLICAPNDVRALRLDTKMQRVGVELELAPQGRYPVGVVWTGIEYVVVWTHGDAVGFSYIPFEVDKQPSTGGTSMTANVAGIAAGSGMLSLLDIRPGVREVRYVVRGTTAQRSVPLNDPALPARTKLVSLYGETLGYVISRVLPEQPYNGVPRIAMAVVAGPRVPLPGTPALTVRTVDDRFLVDWTRPAGVVNGYRLEYRIDDGSWIEYERWFAPTETEIAVRVPSFGSTFSFRVRAINDTGASPYSNTATPLGRKRRATR